MKIGISLARDVVLTLNIDGQRPSVVLRSQKLMRQQDVIENPTFKIQSLKTKSREKNVGSCWSTEII